ncbi:hypothetical protein PAL_GLEAN10002356 [Pteropus alecto]|uniref:Uncharacterized protein n=1 Tax=Pteropus alecto TaxID=9402 RepID=L5KCE3_PTEAL|nr:hypothetical protein PAL_GLEAN10002356 [Pteropus alecto]
MHQPPAPCCVLGTSSVSCAVQAASSPDCSAMEPAHLVPSRPVPRRGPCPARHSDPLDTSVRCCDVADGRPRAAGTGAPSWYFLAAGDTATVSSWTPVLLGHGVTGDTRKPPADLCEVPERSRGVQVRHVCVSPSVRHPVPRREGSVLWEVTTPRHVKAIGDQEVVSNLRADDTPLCCGNKSSFVQASL